MEIGFFLPRLEREKLFPLLETAKIEKVELDSPYIYEERDILPQLLQRGIQILSVHAPYGEKNDLSSPEDKIRKLALAKLRRLITSLPSDQRLKIVIHASPPLKKEEYARRKEYFKSSLEDLLTLAEKFKVTLALENLPPGYLGDKAEDLKEILETFPSPYLGVCLDVGHAHLTEGIEEFFTILKEKIVTTHIHDNNGNEDLHLPPPYGTICWNKLIQKWEEEKVSFPLIIEAYPWGKEEWVWLTIEIENFFSGKILQEGGCYLKCKTCGHFLFGDKKNPFCYCKKESLIGRAL